MEFKDSKTAQNLMKAFAGECQARTRYDYYASKAKKEGFMQISGIFEETALNEKEHAKMFLKQLLNNDMDGSVVNIDAGYPVALADTLKNLEYAAEGEHEEWEELYPSFADVADEEGYPLIARVFRNIAEVEKRHEARYVKLMKNVKEHTVFKKEGVVFWKCRNCGHIEEDIEAPEICPACLHPQKYFEVWEENY